MTSDSNSDTTPDPARASTDDAEAGEATAPSENQSPSAEGEPAEPLDPLTEAERRAASLKDQLLRTAADFENYRRRHRKELDEARLGGAEHLLKELLPVFDNLERATEHAGKATDVTAFASGIQMVIRQFHDTLRKQSIERVPTVGQPFDPNVHEAIQKMATTEVAPGHIAAEIQGGYRSGTRLIRPALVVVAEGSASASPTPPDPTNDETTGSNQSVAHGGDAKDSASPGASESETRLDSEAEPDKT